MAVVEPGKREEPRAGDSRRGAPRSHDRIYDVVRRIPRGRATSYGRVAALAGLPGQARLVGYALHALPPGTAVPWHRVINAAGRISPRRGEPAGSLSQRMRLEREGVRFGPGDRIAAEAWWPDAREPGRAARDRTAPTKIHRRCV